MYSEIVSAEKSNTRVALCLITATKGSTPRKVASKMLVFEDGSIKGTIGGGSLENQVIKDALEVLKTGVSQTFSHQLLKDFKMGCGGSVEIYIEAIEPKKRLYIFGAGHIGRVLARLAQQLDFRVTVIDERKGIFDNWATEGMETINLNHEKAFQQLDFKSNSFIAAISHLHGYDRDIVAHCAKQAHAYLGMIGSKRKIESAKQVFRKKKLLSEDEMNAIDWPMGIPIACQTPEEIAVSILAKLIDVRQKLQ